MYRWTSSLAVAVLGIGCVGGCGGNDSADSNTPETSQVTTTVAVPTTISAASDQLFVVDQSELQASATDMTEIARKFADSFNGFDADAGEALTGPGFQAIDPVYAQLSLSSIGSYYLFLSGVLDTTETVEEIVVNADTSLTRVEWPTFLRTERAGLDGAVTGARQLMVDDGKVTQVMHLFEQADARRYAEEISKTIGFTTFGIPLEQSVADINTEADAATDLAARWSTAWSGHDAAAVQALYADTGVRHDEYAGAPRSPDDVGAWATQLFAAYPDLTVTVDEAFSSGVGPAVVADFTMTVNGAPCTVRVGAVWTIDSNGQIETENVYYDPATLVACGWVN